MTLSNQGSSISGSDLLSLAIEHINFLNQIHALGVSLSKPSKESLRRYRDLWLTLVQSLPNEKLIPPPDIAWLWHCHRLAPFRYEGFLKIKFGLDSPILEANPPFFTQALLSGDRNEWMRNTETQWKLKFPEEPFFLSESTTDKTRAVTCPESSDQNELLDGFDLIASSERQATFLWQVSGPRFSDPTFLDQGVSNYFKFLSLKRLAPAKHQMIVPTYQIDLFWHTHILSKLSRYHEDCCRIIGTKLHHDDSFNDRTKGGALDLAFDATSTLWKEKYHEEYCVQGGMYRGEPPPEFFRKEWADANARNLLFTTNNEYAAPLANTAGWTDVHGVTSSGEPGFIPPLEKSTKRGFNANPRKEDYIFGRGAEGWGYYHHTTREAYVVLQIRLIYQIDELETLVDQMKCVSTVCCCGMKLAAIVDAEEKLVRLREVENLVATSLQTNTAFNFSGIPEDYQLNGDDAKRRVFGGDGGAGGFPGEFYDLAGGCGASADASGGATCGGGGCGGGGCGGGGCGGGGCGGGGCGG